MPVPWQYGKPKSSPARGATLSSHGGASSPSQSRPLSVNQSCFVTGCQVKPTVLRMPRANTSWPEPSAFMRVITPYFGSLHTLHGAPIGK